MSTLPMFKKSLLTLALGALVASSGSALAYEQGDIIVKGGAATVDPDEGSSPINIETLGLGNAVGTKVGVGSDTQLGLTATYMLSSAFGVELLAATPFTHDIYGDGVLRGAGNLAETSHLPPTLTLNWYFGDPNSAFQPYVGAGINYTIFFDESVTSTLDDPGTFNALANLAGAGLPDGDITDVSGTDIDLEDSTGIAFHAGFDYALTDNLGISASYWHIDINTTAEITTTAESTALGTTPIKAHVDVGIDPNVYMLGVAYKF